MKTKEVIAAPAKKTSVAVGASEWEIHDSVTTTTKTSSAQELEQKVTSSTAAIADIYMRKPGCLFGLDNEESVKTGQAEDRAVQIQDGQSWNISDASVDLSSMDLAVGRMEKLLMQNVSYHRRNIIVNPRAAHDLPRLSYGRSNRK